MLSGQVPAGGECRIDEECADGWCNLSASCPGTCRPRLPHGGWCTRTAQCVAGQICDVACTDLAAEPQPPPGPGEPCSGPLECAPRSWCSIDRRCVPDLVEGQDCGMMIEGCPDGTLCDGVCRRPTLVDEAGGACLDGRFCDPLAGLYCDAETAQCRELPGPGETCAPGVGAIGCRQGSFCDVSTELCNAPRADGEPCSYNDWCESGDCRGGACVPPVSCPE